jgi:hypothetical protein
MARFDFVQEIFDGVFKKFIGSSPTGWQRFFAGVFERWIFRFFSDSGKGWPAGPP